MRAEAWRMASQIQVGKRQGIIGGTRSGGGRELEEVALEGPTLD